MNQAALIPQATQLFTLGRVKKSLPYIGRILGDIVEDYQRRAVFFRKIERVDLGLESGDAAALAAQNSEVVERLIDRINELRDAGGELLNPESGVVMFRTVTGTGEAVIVWSLTEGGKPRVTTEGEARAQFLKGGV